jgi:hypothetical protein
MLQNKTDISADISLKDTCTNIRLTNIWAGVKQEFRHILSVAMKKLLPFLSTYLCRTACSRHATTEVKCQNRLNAEHNMIQLSKIIPGFNFLVSSKYVHLLG